VPFVGVMHIENLHLLVCPIDPILDRVYPADIYLQQPPHIIGSE
jgi:hypothetical protein